MRRKLMLLLALGAAMVLALTLPPTAALAAAGDRTISKTNTDVWLATNQCPQANGYIHFGGGSPQSPAWIFVKATAGGGPKCQSRIRIVYVPNSWNNRPVTTAWQYRTNTTSPAGPDVYGFRCYVEFSVRRNDGSFFSRFLVSPNKPPHCPY